MTDYYAVLGISRLAEGDEVARAYRRSALTLNPACAPTVALEHQSGDNNIKNIHSASTATASSSSSTTEQEARRAEMYRRFRLVGQAYTVLSDPKYRGIYDTYGEDGVRFGGTAATVLPLDLDAIDPDVVFKKFFGVDDPFHVTIEAQGANNQAHTFFSEDAVRVKNPPPADELVHELTVTLEEVFAGATKTVEYTANHYTAAGKVASATRKSTQFSIPLGVEDGQSFTFKGIGHTGDQKSAGPLRIVVRTATHAVYRRERLDLVVTASITLCQALTGVTITVPTIDKREVNVAIDEVACHEYRCRLKGEGLPAADGQSRGDLIVECLPVFPAYLSAEQKRELKRVLGESN